MNTAGVGSKLSDQFENVESSTEVVYSVQLLLASYRSLIKSCSKLGKKSSLALCSLSSNWTLSVLTAALGPALGVAGQPLSSLIRSDRLGYL